MEPNKENIKKWVDTLRSGSYGQCRGKLNNGEGFCCLGVACEVAMVNQVTIAKEKAEHCLHTKWTYDGTGYSLPESVQQWLGVEDCPMLVKDGVEKEAIALNDEDKVSFAVIADWIEATYLSV